MKILLDHRFDKAIVANPDGTSPIQLSGTTVVPGAIDSRLGRLAGAIDLGSVGRGVVDIGALPLDLARFCVRVVVRADAPVTGRQNLVESSKLPFALFLERGRQAGEFIAVASVNPTAHGWQETTTQFGPPLRPDTWYTIDLVFDLDTVGLLVDGVVASVRAFPDGRTAAMAGSELFLGTWVDGAQYHFNGKVAALQLYAGIPEDLERQLDERRDHPEWFISHKRLALATVFNLGAPTAAVAFDEAASAYVQPHATGLVMYRNGAGTSFEMHGAIHQAYVASDRKAELGYLTSDEGAASRRQGGRKNTFSKGAIYWSPATGAAPVLDRIYLSYEDIEGVDVIGFPSRPPGPVAGGSEQLFQNGRMYHRAGTPTAHEVHGAILAKYLQLGGVGRWGFPVSDEQDVMRDGQAIGKASEFEGCTIYWSSRTGAFEVHGDLRLHYRNLRGPAGALGFPTSDELDIAGGSGRFNTFENGSLCWYGSPGSIIHARPFTIFLDRIETVESEGFAMGQNDIYLREVRVDQGGRTLYNQRHPREGDWGGRNAVEVDLAIPVVIVPNHPGGVVTFSVDVWEADPGDDDHLGRYTKELGPANAWGLRENQGVFNSGAFNKVRAILWSVKPQVDVAALSEPEKFWGKDNDPTAVIPYERYAAAFRDVDSESEWWDIPDWLQKAFYELVVDTLASGGNCFGMSLEAIHARKNLSRFGLPLNRFTTWSQLEPEFNVKHCYQVGASAIWWFVGQFVTGNTHDPGDVFRRSRDAFWRGSHPVLCVAQNYDFGGAPHCILPVAWHDGAKPWRIDILDPNFPNQLRQLIVDPDANTFRYVGSSTYEGGAWSGGRLHYMPFDVLDRPPRTPLWDAILLLLAGTVVILGADAQTGSIADPAGNDLDAHGERAKQTLQRRGRLDEYFVSYKGFAGRGTIAGEFLAQLGRSSAGAARPSLAADPGERSRLLLGDLLADRALRPVAAELAGAGGLREAISGRTLARVLADPQASARLGRVSLDALRAAMDATQRGDFVHKVVGLRAGSLQYVAKHGFSEVQVGAPIAARERNEIRMRDVGTNDWSLALAGDRDKRVDVVLESKLGAGPDRIRLKVNDLPMRAADGLKMNLGAGLGGIEIVTQGGRVEVPVEVQTMVGGRLQERRFRMPMEGGVRVRVSSVLSTGDLTIGRIPQLFGPISDKITLRPQ